MENRDIVLLLGLGVVGYYIYNKTKSGSDLNVKTFVEENLSNVPTSVPTSVPTNAPVAPQEPTAPIPMPTAAPATTIPTPSSAAPVG